MKVSGVHEGRAQALAALRDGQRFCLTTHERPDGDAAGSLAAMQLTLAALGKDAVAFMAPDEFPLPYEYREVALENLVTTVPPDLDRRVLVCLDCGNVDRTPPALAQRVTGPARAGRDGVIVVNIDHHHDNTRFGTVNHVDAAASCTAEMVWELMGDLGVELTRPIAEALYVGLVTDTGRFMYDNTGPRAHEMAADLLAAGADAHGIYRRLYEGVPQAKLDLLARGLLGVRRYDAGLLTVTNLTRADFAATGADESYSEGVVDHLRSLAGTAVAGLVREIPAGGEIARKVSLRATDDRVDVSVIARAAGGGGHRRAAGFTTGMGFEELVAFLRAGLAGQLVLDEDPATPDGAPVEPAARPATPDGVPVEPAARPATPDGVPVEPAPRPATPDGVPVEPWTA